MGPELKPWKLSFLHLFRRAITKRRHPYGHDGLSRKLSNLVASIFNFGRNRKPCTCHYYIGITVYIMNEKAFVILKISEISFDFSLSGEVGFIFIVIILIFVLHIYLQQTQMNLLGRRQNMGRIDLIPLKTFFFLIKILLKKIFISPN